MDVDWEQAFYWKVVKNVDCDECPAKTDELCTDINPTIHGSRIQKYLALVNPPKDDVTVAEEAGITRKDYPQMHKIFEGDDDGVRGVSQAGQ